MTYYPAGPYAPDRAPRLNDAFLRTADGVLASKDGYRPLGQWAQEYTAISGTPKGGASFVSPTGTASIIVGDQTALYKAFGSGFQQIGSGYSLQGNMRWRFAQFGSLAIATNSADPLIKVNLEDGSVSQLGGNPPRGEFLAVVKDFLVISCPDGNVNRVRWSGINNAEWWTIAQRQADEQTLPDGGRVNGILSGEEGYILQRKAIRRMSYVGGNLIFTIDVVANNIGCITPHSVTQFGSLGFFLSEQGWYGIEGGRIFPIGNEWIDRAFLNAYDEQDWPKMSTAIDPVNKVLMVAMPDKVWIYHFGISGEGQHFWTTAPYASPVIFSAVTKGISIDETDDAVGVLDDDVDGAGLVTLDDQIFDGGAPRLWVFSSGKALGTFSGTPMAATFEGNDIEAFQGRRANARFVRPDIDAVTGLTLTLTTKQRLADTGTVSTSTSVRDSGDMPVRSSGRYTRPKLQVSAGTAWTYYRGYELIAVPGARR